MIVHVIDDDDAARDSVAFLLGTAGFGTLTYESAKAFLDVLGSTKPGVIVSDLRMPEVDGLELLRRLNSQRVDWPVIIITGHGDAAAAIELIRAGALEFIEKPFNDDELLAIVRAAFAADRGVNDRVDLIKERLDGLSTTERRVGEALTDGRSNFEIAQSLGINQHLVEVHRANLLRKMGAKSLSHLVRAMILTDTRR